MIIKSALRFFVFLFCLIALSTRPLNASEQKGRFEPQVQIRIENRSVVLSQKSVSARKNEDPRSRSESSQRNQFELVDQPSSTFNKSSQTQRGGDWGGGSGFKQEIQSHLKERIVSAIGSLTSAQWMEIEKLVDRTIRKDANAKFPTRTEFIQDVLIGTPDYRFESDIRLNGFPVSAKTQHTRGATIYFDDLDFADMGLAFYVRLGIHEHFRHFGYRDEDNQVQKIFSYFLGCHFTQNNETLVLEVDGMSVFRQRWMIESSRWQNIWVIETQYKNLLKEKIVASGCRFLCRSEYLGFYLENHPFYKFSIGGLNYSVEQVHSDAARTYLQNLVDEKVCADFVEPTEVGSRAQCNSH